ncbi:MAG: M48 family metalloprotease, partial [Myxococcales bacterium]|nr:M48 family metalloprotease [Myxococcales bacterium]
MPPSSWMRLLELGVALPVLATLLQAIDALTPPVGMLVLRIEQWSATMITSSATVWVPALTLLVGTTLLFVAQELVPRLIDMRYRTSAGQKGTPRLQASLDRVKAAYAACGAAAGNRRQLAHVARTRVRVIDSERRQAELSGSSAPLVSVSRGLADALDDEALDAVIAHELAHLVVGGRARLWTLWSLRLLQASSPAALVTFRSLIEAREAACDALAARVTQKPLALAAALLEAHRLAVGREGESRLARAQRRVLRRAELA